MSDAANAGRLHLENATFEADIISVRRLAVVGLRNSLNFRHVNAADIQHEPTIPPHLAQIASADGRMLT